MAGDDPAHHPRADRASPRSAGARHGAARGTALTTVRIARGARVPRRAGAGRGQPRRRRPRAPVLGRGGLRGADPGGAPPQRGRGRFAARLAGREALEGDRRLRLTNLLCVIDDGEAIHYSAVTRGTPVYSADGTEVGVVEAIFDNYREHIFDGVVFRDREGTMRF